MKKSANKTTKTTTAKSAKVSTKKADRKPTSKSGKTAKVTATVVTTAMIGSDVRNILTGSKTPLTSSAIRSKLYAKYAVGSNETTKDLVRRSVAGNLAALRRTNKITKDNASAYTCCK